MNERSGKRLRLLVAGALLAGHVANYAIQALLGHLHPIGFLRELLGSGKVDDHELFQMLLLAANLALGPALISGRGNLMLGAGSMFLILAHAWVGVRVVPDPLTSGAALVVNILVLYVGTRLSERLPAKHLAAFAASYFALFFIFVEIKWGFLIPALKGRTGMGNAEPLFLLFVMGLCACARSWRLLAWFWAVTVSFTFLQPYAWESAVVLCFIVAALFGARGALRSPTALVFLGVGLALAGLVLFPVVAAIMGESPQNLGNILGDERIQKAVGRTLVTATASTLFLVALAVPLAYALARLHFPGRSLLLAAIDVPIVIPQSVAGLALVRVFGAGQPLGGVIENVFGVRFDGTLWGVCLAQVFVAMPFIVKAALAAFESVPVELELSARTLGASPWNAFRRVALPLASRGIFLGAVLAWARAAGEFGALLFIASNSEVETAPVLAWNLFGSVGSAQAGPLVAVLLGFSLAMFFLLQLATRTLPRPAVAQNADATAAAQRAEATA